MSAREVGGSNDSSSMSRPRKTPPARMRNYRIVAEPRTEPDLHKLAQLFIGMAFARADADREARDDPAELPLPEPPSGASECQSWTLRLDTPDSLT